MKIQYKKIFNKYNFSFKESIIILIYRLFLKYRKLFKKVKPITNREEHLFREHHSIDKKCSEVPLGYNIKEKREEDAFINPEYIDIIDYIPKENLSAFLKEVKKYAKKHSNSFFEKTEDEIEKQVASIDNYKPWSSYSLVVNLSVKKEKEICDYTNQFDISLLNLSNTFCAVRYRYYMNQNLKEQYNQVVKNEYTGDVVPIKLHSRPWYKVTGYGLSIRSGDKVRKINIYRFFSKIEFKLIENICNNFTTYFSKSEVPFPIFETYSTNIRPQHKKSNFWEGMPFGNSVDYAPIFNTCICFNPNSDYDDDCKLVAYNGDDYTYETFASSIFKYDVSEIYVAYMAAKGINKILSKSIQKYNKRISQTMKLATTNRLLKIRYNMKRDIFYPYRFASEYKGLSLHFEDAEIFVNQYMNSSFTKLEFDGSIEDTEQNKNNADNLLNLLNSLTEYSNSKGSFSNFV